MNFSGHYLNGPAALIAVTHGVSDIRTQGSGMGFQALEEVESTYPTAILGF